MRILIAILLLTISITASADNIIYEKTIFPKDKEGVVKKEITLDEETITIVTQQNPFCEFEYNVLCVFGEETRNVHFNKSRQELTDKEILNKIREVKAQVDYEKTDEYKVIQIDARLAEIEKVEIEKQELISKKEKLRRLRN